MVHYTSQHQLKIEEFGSLYQMKLDPKNRWVLLANHSPWDRCVQLFVKQFSHIGRKAINPRIVIGRLIIKHKLNISDEETVLLIRENPYMRYFLGLDEFYPYSLFTPTLFKVDLPGLFIFGGTVCRKTFVFSDFRGYNSGIRV